MRTKKLSPQPYQRHPWPAWFARKEFTLVRGQDFDGPAHSFAQQLRNKALSDKYRLRVSVKILEGPDRIEVLVLGKLKEKN